MLEKIFQFDQQLFLRLNNGLRSPLGDILFGYTTWLGEGFVLYPLCLLLAFFLDRKNFWRNAVLISIAMAAAGLINSAIKEYVQRLRPLAKFGGWKESGYWHPGNKETYTIMFRPYMYNSFPSGHSVSAFGAAMLFSLFYPRARGRLLLAALVVMISRVYVGAHFPLDTVAGALLGGAVSALVFFVYRSYSHASLRGDAGAVKRTRL